MFAVPGWSVSASNIVTQTQQKSESQPKPNNAATGANAEIPGSKKRKRGKKGDGIDEKVTGKNLEAMWRKHIEGEDVTANAQVKPKPAKGNAKKQRVEGDNVDGVTENADEKNAVPPKRKTLKEKKREKKQKGSPNGEAANTAALVDSLPPPPPPTALTPLQNSMRQKLLSSRFRHLNETLYTTPSSHALELFSNSPELFTEYHTGFSRQVKESWPENPVHGYIKAIKTRAAAHSDKPNKKAVIDRSAALEPLPRRPSGLCTIADLGCGDAQLGRNVRKVKDLRVFSYDLHSTDPIVTKADIANLPLKDGSVDLTIFCLSLMGTNWISFVEEAWRVLRGDGRGECWVSEVKSRFGKVKRKGGIGATKTPNSKPGGPAAGNNKKREKETEAADEELFAEDHQQAADDETDISAFVDVFRARGFVLRPDSVDKSNKMFVRMEFVKQGFPTRGKYAGQGGRPEVNKGGPNSGFGKRPGFGGGAKPKFIDETAADAKALEEEAKVLKPCVYKIR